MIYLESMSNKIRKIIMNYRLMLILILHTACILIDNDVRVCVKNVCSGKIRLE